MKIRLLEYMEVQISKLYGPKKKSKSTPPKAALAAEYMTKAGSCRMRT